MLKLMLATQCTPTSAPHFPHRAFANRICDNGIEVAQQFGHSRVIAMKFTGLHPWRTRTVGETRGQTANVPPSLDRMFAPPRSLPVRQQDQWLLKTTPTVPGGLCDEPGSCSPTECFVLPLTSAPASPYRPGRRQYIAPQQP